jgi:hypothetical protein
MPDTIPDDPQLPNESPAAYARYLLFRSLGPGRTVEAAYKLHWRRMSEREETCPRRAPPNWYTEATRHRWRDRADAWDMRVLIGVGEHAIAGHVALLDALARRAVRWVEESAGPSDPAWGRLLDTIDVFSRAVPPDMLAAIIAPGGAAAPR